MMCVSQSLLLAHRAARERSPSWLAATGAALGLGVLARSEVALLVPLVAVWLLLADRSPREHWRGAVLTVAVSAAVVAPWAAFNLSRFENPVLLTTNDGTTWLGANCPQTYSGADIGGWTIECVAADPDYRPDEEPSVRSVRQRAMARQFVGEATLGQLSKVAVARVARTIDLYGLGDLVKQDVGEERPLWAVWAGIVGFWVLAPLAVLGAVRSRRRTRFLLLAPVVVVLVTTVLFYGAHRIRSSAEPSLVVLAASGALVMLQRLRHTDLA
jgi:4-amino-4-deoxy-L-arabinose transferase-like glycosyltransferase